MRTLCCLLLCVWTSAGMADEARVEVAVHASFDDMPVVTRLQDISQSCGAMGMANPDIAFCTSENIVYLRNGTDHAAYKLAHVMGHAVQVRHGIADIALREIRKRPDEEMVLRGLVTRQVDCIAGFLIAKAGVAPMDFTAFEREPFTGSHWGRNPLRIGPKVSIGTQARAEWFDKGYQAGDLGVCAAGEMGAGLLLQAYRG